MTNLATWTVCGPDPALAPSPRPRTPRVRRRPTSPRLSPKKPVLATRRPPGLHVEQPSSPPPQPLRRSRPAPLPAGHADHQHTKAGQRSPASPNTETKRKEVKVGDIVLFNWGGKGGCDHAGVITKTKNGKAHVSAHTGARLNKSLRSRMVLMPSTYRRRLSVMAVAVTVLAAVPAIWWLLRDPTPYSLRKTPAVTVTVHAENSEYPDTQGTADDVDLLVKVYIQRLESGDASDLARIGAPWYTGRQRAAREMVDRYSAHAGGPVEAIVQEPVVPYLADVDLHFGDGQRQTLQLSRDHDDVWWLQLGEGDPTAP
ncbi:amidase domain-containing protein [Streptomyces sp. NPDC094153]|uniref:amidase domain-containing protein n=1 Tax=Streptomyces sp. NPDC094153 TaxID=3366058 RepID=UPI0038121903